MHLTKMTEKEILELINPLMDNCLAGSNEDNHDKHVKDFTGRMKAIVTPENLKNQLAQTPRAYFTHREFVHLFRRENSIGVVWKQFISTSSDELMNQAIFALPKGQGASVAKSLGHCFDPVTRNDNGGATQRI